LLELVADEPSSAQPFPQQQREPPRLARARRRGRRRSDRLRPYYMTIVGAVSAVIGLGVGLGWQKPARLAGLVVDVGEPVLAGEHQPHDELHVPSAPVIPPPVDWVPAASPPVAPEPVAALAPVPAPVVIAPTLPTAAPPRLRPEAIEASSEASRVVGRDRATKAWDRAKKRKIARKLRPTPSLVPPDERTKETPRAAAAGFAPAAPSAAGRKVREGRLLDPFAGGR
jgi:hypothetical protein